MGLNLKLSITTGIATAFLNQGLSWLKETMQRRENERRAGRMLALSIVEALTSYAQECSARVRSNRWDASIGEYGTSKIPFLRSTMTDIPRGRCFRLRLLAHYEISKTKRTTPRGS